MAGSEESSYAAGKSGLMGMTRAMAVELGPKGSWYALDCFPDVWKDAIVARGEIENEFKKALRRVKK